MRARKSAPISSKLKKRVGLAFIIAIASLMIAFVVSYDDSIVRRATPIASVSEWAFPSDLNYEYLTTVLPGLPFSDSGMNKLNSFYLWINNKELLTFRRIPGGMQTYRTKLRKDGSTTSELIPGLEMKGDPEPVSISHDGKSLLWYDRISYGTITPCILSFDGHFLKKLPKCFYRRYFWSFDDKCLAYANQHENSTFDMDQRGQFRTYDIASGKELQITYNLPRVSMKIFPHLCFPSKNKIIFDGKIAGSEGWDGFGLIVVEMPYTSSHPKIIEFAIPKNEMIGYKTIPSPNC